MAVRGDGLNNRRRVQRAMQVLGLAVLLTLAVGIGLTSSGAFAGSLTGNTAGLAHAPALTDTPTPTNTPDPCDPAWSVVSSPNVGTSSNYLNGVAVVLANDVWAVGYYYNGSGISQTLVEHWNGTSWLVVSSPNVGTSSNYLYGVAAVSTNDVWAVGNHSNCCGPGQTLIEHWNGTSWSVVSGPTRTTYDYLYGIAALSTNDVWAVGKQQDSNTPRTLVEHWNGTSWSVVPSPNVGTSYNVLSGVAAVSTNDVWAVGYYGSGVVDQTLVEHWNGTSWLVVSSPNGASDSNNYLDGIAVVSANDVWAVGDYCCNANGGTTLAEHWDGTSWSVVPSPNVGTSYNYLYGVAMVSANDVWAVGYYGPLGAYQTLVEHYTSPCTTPTAIINGHLTWQGITQPNITNTQVTGTLTLCNAPAPPTYTFTTNSTGNFTITTGLPDGAYHWYTKGGRHVSSSSPTDGAPLVISGGHATYEFGTQLGGDTNGDNLANASDFNALKTQFNIANGQYSSDFDYNLRVNVLDFNMLKRNFNLSQHNLACP